MIAKDGAPPDTAAPAEAPQKEVATSSELSESNTAEDVDDSHASSEGAAPLGPMAPSGGSDATVGGGSGRDSGLGTRDPPHAHSAIRETSCGTKPPSRIL